MVEQLAREHQQELAAAGTLVDLEELTAWIGDECGRQLCENELTDRSGRAAKLEQCECPKCGSLCPRGDPEPVVLQGLRGEIAFSQPSYFCPRCRRSFFPSGRSFGIAGAGDGHAEDFAEDDLGRQLAERKAAVERFKEMDLPKQQIGSTAIDPPQIAVTSMDGGRYQRRDHFGERDRPAREKHWREDKAFVADGAHANWTIQRKHFSHATPILDLMHALSYAFSAALAVPEKDVYRRWADWIWRGEVDRVISALRERQLQIGPPPAEASPTDPRKRVDRALTYYEYHRLRMNYPEYRRLGLPLTSSHIESTIKQINRRVKGTEKFWSQSSSEAVLQLRADYLSDSAPLVSFRLRHQASQTGVNAYAQAP